MAKIISTNPFTEELNAEFETLSREALDMKIQKAHEAFLLWKNTPKSEKKRLMLALADTIESQQAELAEIQTKEMGMLYAYSF
jgi:succinate-semialdehyde dehydrogenase/glutarate-semialdehyde dehydrogenase